MGLFKIERLRSTGWKIWDVNRQKGWGVSKISQFSWTSYMNRSKNAVNCDVAKKHPG